MMFLPWYSGITGLISYICIWVFILKVLFFDFLLCVTISFVNFDISDQAGFSLLEFNGEAIIFF